MDGVISDTQKLHSKVEAEIFRSYGVHISPEEITEKYSGVKDTEFFGNLLPDKDINIEEVIERKWVEMNSLVKEGVDSIEGVIELIEFLSEKEYKMAVGSASNLNYVNAVLKELNIIKFFDSVTSSEEVKYGKPNPETFLLAAKRINIHPEECVVIEDGISGMIAANRAKMLSVGLVDTKDKKKYPAKILVKKLSEIRDIL